jgi:hypothetical protein
LSTIDKQRIAAVRKLEQLGYTFSDWMHPASIYDDAYPQDTARLFIAAIRWEATEQVLALVERTRCSLAKINGNCVNANGVFRHPDTQLAALRAARDHVDEAIEIIQARYKDLSDSAV